MLLRTTLTLTLTLTLIGVEDGIHRTLDGYGNYRPYRDVEDSRFVVVSEVRSFKISIIGKVNSPGRFHLSSPTTVLEVLAQAGGLQEYADEDSIFVLRRRISSASAPRKAAP